MNLDEIKRRTGEELRGAVHSDEPVLLEAPPASGKTHNAIKLAAVEGLNITYFARRVDLYEQALNIAAQIDEITFDTIPSPHRDCPTFKGENNGDTEKAKRLYQKGVSGRDIHYRSRNSVYTPCMAGGDCRYIKKRRRVGDDEYLADIDLLIGNHQHAYNEAYLADRVVIFDEFNPDPFVSRFPDDDAEFATNSPAAIIKTFLGAVDKFPFDDVTDLIEARATESPDFQTALEWFRKRGASRETANDVQTPTSHQYDTAHTLAPRLTLALLLMEKVGPDIELAHDPETWAAADIEPGFRCLRDRNTGEMLVLQPPMLESAAQVIGLDALPTPRLWATVFDCSFDHRQLIPRQQLDTYRRTALGIELVQLAEGMNPYSGGLISTQDSARFRAVRCLEGKPVPLITRKQALATYRNHSWFETCVRTGNGDASANGVEQYATIRSSNEFADETVGVVSGSPYPSDDVIKRWAGLCGRATVPKRPQNTLEGFTRFGQAVYEHFTHHQVFQAILRFGRNLEDDDITVYVNTKALPSWLSPDVTLAINSRDANPKRTLVVEALIRESQATNRPAQQTVSSLHSLLDQRLEKGKDPDIAAHIDKITKRYVRTVLEESDFAPVIDVEPNAGKGGADLFAWSEDADLRPLEFESKNQYLFVGPSSAQILEI